MRTAQLAHLTSHCSILIEIRNLCQLHYNLSDIRQITVRFFAQPWTESGLEMIYHHSPAPGRGQKHFVHSAISIHHLQPRTRCWIHGSCLDGWWAERKPIKSKVNHFSFRQTRTNLCRPSFKWSPSPGQGVPHNEITLAQYLSQSIFTIPGRPTGKPNPHSNGSVRPSIHCSKTDVVRVKWPEK